MKLVGLLFLLILVLAGAGAFFVVAPFGPHGETFVEIPAGAGTVGMATRLEKGGVVRNTLAFELYRKFKGGTLRAGEYRFDHPASLMEVYARIARGDVYTRTLVIPEGFNIFDVAQAVAGAGLGSAPAFLAAERTNTQLITDLSPHAVSLEGYLFPDTYKFSRHATPLTMLTAMVKRFRQESSALGLVQGPESSQVVTMASLIEKEVRVDAERPLVGGVFVNRVSAGIPLATDPSVIYAAMLAGRWRGTIYASDLRAASPYNTYLHAGLPPGPIANPGVAALKAAMHPADTKYLYFVADAAGHTQFSVDLEGHNRQVAEFRAAGRAVQAQ